MKILIVIGFYHDTIMHSSFLYHCRKAVLCVLPTILKQPVSTFQFLYVIHSLSWVDVVYGVQRTLILTEIHRKMTWSVSPEKIASQSTGPLCLFHESGFFLYDRSSTTRQQWRGAQMCLKIVFARNMITLDENNCSLNLSGFCRWQSSHQGKWRRNTNCWQRTQ